MLAIRLQRVGRKGAPIYRLIAQDSHRHPSSGNVAATLGTYNPHDKTVQLDTEKITFYLEHGARPTSRIVRLLMAEKVKLPKWVEKLDAKKKVTIKNPEKLRRNRPATAESTADKPEEPMAAEPEATETPAEAPEATEAATESPAAEETATEAAPAETAEAPTEETEVVEAPTEEVASEAETPAEEKPAEPAEKAKE